MASTIKKSKSSRTRRTKRRRKKSRDWVSDLFLKVIAIVVLIGALSSFQESQWAAEKFQLDPPASQLVDFDRHLIPIEPEWELGRNFVDPSFQQWR